MSKKKVEKSAEPLEEKKPVKRSKKNSSSANDISPKISKKKSNDSVDTKDGKQNISEEKLQELKNINLVQKNDKKMKKPKPIKKVKIEADLDLPEDLDVVDLNTKQPINVMQADKPVEVTKDIPEPEIVSILRLKKKKRKEIRFEKRRLKKSGRIVTRKHLKRLRRGLEVPRYKPNLEYGLTETAISRRINEGLINKKVETTSKTYKKIFFSNILTFFNFLTISIAIWLITVGAWTDLIFLIIVTANMVIGIYQEIKAKRTIDRLSILSAPSATVLRNGEVKDLPVGKLILDDVTLLETGKQIVTDSVIVEGLIEVNESLLTGESDPIVKKPGDFIYAGSFVVSGYAKAQVEKIGRDNFIETLTSQAKQHKKPKSELLNALNTIIRVMSIVIILLGAILFTMQYENLWGNIEYRYAVRATAGAMIGMIPAGLFLTTSIALFVGVVKLADYNVLVRELYSLEMLARINVLCLDKTGTITDGTMNVKNVVEYSTVSGLSTKYIVSAMLNALNDKNLTSVALEEKFGLGKRIKHDAIIPFSSSRKYSAVDFGRYGTFVLGAPDIIMKHNYSLLQKEVDKYSKEGYRVILLAHSSEKIQNEEINLKTFQQVSLILIEDNIRPDAIKTIDYFKKSGVEVKVISGDNPLTVSMIGQRAGILNAEKCISLDGLTDEEVIASADKYTVFGRVSPGQKQLLVRTLKKLDKVVAMTGDGVNDILALKEADCSIAVASGSEAARSVSHLVLLDSNFGSMPKVVSEGRRVINNVAKVASLFLTKTIFSLLLAIQAIQSGGQYPITTIQLLMIDLLVIGIPSMILILEPNNVKYAGNFLFRIIKGALPGAVAILITSMIVFALQDTLQLNFRETSTIIVISATFTGMMVLFELCKPLNALRRGLCSAMFGTFVFVTLFFPQLFEFSPFMSFSQYHHDTVEINRIIGSPSIHVTVSNQLIIDNQITDIRHIPTLEVQTRTVRLIDNTNVLFVGVGSNAISTNRILELPQIFTNEIDTEYLVFDARPIDILHVNARDSSLTIRPNGDVVLQRDGLVDVVVDNVLPNVGISNSPNHRNNLIINGNITQLSGVSRIESVSIRRIEEHNIYVLVLNDDQILTSPIHENGFEINLPVLSITDNNRYAIGGRVSTLEEEASGLESVNFRFTESGNIQFHRIPDEINGWQAVDGVNFLPDVRTTGNGGYWIFGDQVSWFRVEGREGTWDLTFDESSYDNSDNTANLIINGVLTHVRINVYRQIGGDVPILPTEAIILLLLLCAISAPLIKFLKAVVPWTKKHIDNFSEIIANL